MLRACCDMRRRYLYPVGYTAIREYASYRNPDSRVTYRCEILDSSPPPGWTASGERTAETNAADGKAIKTNKINGDKQEAEAEAEAEAGAEEWVPPSSRSPIFRVTASDDAMAPIDGKTPGAPWNEVGITHKLRLVSPLTSASNCVAFVSPLRPHTRTQNKHAHRTTHNAKTQRS